MTNHIAPHDPKLAASLRAALDRPTPLASRFGRRVTESEKPRALPRRANTIRAVAATRYPMRSEIAWRAPTSVIFLWAIVAALIGAATFRYAGREGVGCLVALYAVSAWLSCRRYRRLVAQ